MAKGTYTAGFFFNGKTGRPRSQIFFGGLNSWPALSDHIIVRDNEIHHAAYGGIRVARSDSE